MIEIELRHAVPLYSTVLGIVVLAIWIYTEITVRRTYRRLEKQNLWRCVFCGYTYLDEAAERVSLCPRCQSYNSIEDKHARLVPVSTELLPPDEPSAEPSRPARNPSRQKRPGRRRRGPRRR